MIAVETMVTREDTPTQRFRPYCGRLLPDLPGRLRCMLLNGHDGGCSEAS
jgi:hypothetical protein